MKLSMKREKPAPAVVAAETGHFRYRFRCLGLCRLNMGYSGFT